MPIRLTSLYSDPANNWRMYEGKNIHYSNTDNKLLCSFSGKLCNQRRLNGYGFCVRHILEDPTAPFKRCAYVAKSSNQMCTQAIPKNEDRRYCNNHMQVLGMLPKKERKKKDNKTTASVTSTLTESGLLLPNGGLAMKPKFSLSVNKDGPSSRSAALQLTSATASSSAGDTDDPYAFSDSAPMETGNKSAGGVAVSSLSAAMDSVLGKSLQSGTGFVRSASDIGGNTSTSTLGSMSAGGSMIAKYYPELAEKLEKIRAAKPEPKASPKSRAKSSRTMNKLQTKIAQNKINEKLRKSQELNLNQTDSNSSPVQLSSPETGGIIVDQSPGSSPATVFSPNISSLSFSPQSTTAGFYQPATVTSNLIGGFEIAQQQQPRVPEVPPLPQVDTSLLATLATQDNMGFHTTEGESNAGSNMTVNVVNNPAANRLLPPRLPPPPYPGSSVLSQQPSAMTPSDLASVAVAFGSPKPKTVIDNSSSVSASLSARFHQLQQQQQQQNLLTTMTLTTVAAPSAVAVVGSNFSSNSSVATSVSSLPFNPPTSISNQQHLSKIATPLFLSPTSTNPGLAFSPALPSSSSSNIEHRPHHHIPIPVNHNNIIKTLPNHHLSSMPQLAPTSSSSSSITNNADIFSLLNSINRKPLMVDTKSSSLSSNSQHLVSTIPSPNTVAAQLSLPPPPPYVPPKVSSSTPSLSSSSLLTSSSSSSSSSATSLAVQMPPVPSPRVRQQQNVRPVVVASTVPHMNLRKLKGVLDDKEVVAKLKTKSAAKYYSYYAKQKMNNHSMVGSYLCSSEEDSVDEDSELLPWQPEIFSASSDDQDDDEDDEYDTNVPVSMRPTKLSLMKTRLRRQWHQAHQAYRSNQATVKSHNQATLALIQTVRENGACAVRALWHIGHVKKSKKKLKKMLPKKKKTCCHKSSTDGPCTNPCLPYTNHCLRHIMYNIDQQIFDYCTAKFADNTQCCMPVFDIRHELPLCPVHAAKADNYQKQMELENKKKPRKKSKPAALTRPPRKGKKKKKGRYSRQQKSQPTADAANGGLDSTLSDVDVLGVDTPSSQAQDTDDLSSTAIDVVSTGNEDKSVSMTGSSSLVTPMDTSSNHQTTSSTPSSMGNRTLTLSSISSSSASSSLPSSRGVTMSSNSSSTVKDRNNSAITSQQMEQAALELEETLSPDFEKQFELPLEQASRLLEESDFQEVVNKMPFEALDLFGKQGDGDQDEVDQVPLDQVSANKARDTIEKLLCGDMSEEESMQLAMVLAQNLHTDVALLTAPDGVNSSVCGGASSSVVGDGIGITTTNGMAVTTCLESGSGGMVSTTSSGVGNTGGPLGLQQDQHFVMQGPTNVTIEPQHHRQQQQQQAHPHQLNSSTKPAMHSIVGFSTSSSSSPSSSQSPGGHQNQLHATTSQQMSSSSPLSSIPSTMSQPPPAYGQMDPFTMSGNQNILRQQHQQNQSSSFSGGLTAKTVVRHLSTGSQQRSPQNTRVTGTVPPNQANVATFKSPMGSLDIAASSKIMAGNVTLNPVLGEQQGGEFRIDRPSSAKSSSSSFLSSSLSLPSLAKKAKLNDNSSSTGVLHHPTKQQTQTLQQNLQIKHFKQLQQQQSPSQQQQQHLLSSSSPLKSGQRINLMDTNAQSPPSNLIKLSKSQPPGSPSSSSSAILDQNSLREFTTSPKLPHPHSNMGSPKLKLLPHKSSPLSQADLLNSSSAQSVGKANKLTLPTNRKSHSPAPSSIPSSSSSSLLLLPQNLQSVSSTTTSNSLRTANTPVNTFPNPLRKALNLTADDDDDSPSESISVTVRHPSSLEAVPTTVRHTLPDTFPTHNSLPSSPLQLLPKSSSVVNSPSRSLTSSPAPHSQSVHPASGSLSASSSPQPHILNLDNTNTSNNHHFKQFKSSSSSSLQQQLQQTSSSTDLHHSVLSSQLQHNSQWTSSPSSQLTPTSQQNQQTTALLTNGGLPSINSISPQNKSTNLNLKASPGGNQESSSSSPISSKLNLKGSPSSHHHNVHHPPSSSLSQQLSNSTPSARKSLTNANLTSALSHHPVGGVVPNSKQLHVQPGAMPVVCNAAVTMSKFTPPLPATAFKTSGTS